MRDIPSEILAAAERVAECLNPGTVVHALVLDAAVRAIMAERERGAKYATDQAEREPYGHCKATAYLIADNIMGGPLV